MLGGMLQQVLSDPVKSPDGDHGASWQVTAWDREDLDITNETEVRQKIIELRPEAIVNAAGYTNVDGAEDAANREICFAVNERAVGYLAQVAKELDIPLVHYSTDYVFPGDTKTGYGEDDAPGPAVNVYGQAKLAGERALKESGAKFYLLRTAWLYGPGGKNFVDTMLKLGKEKDYLDIVEDQHGSPTFTKDVAQATKTILAEKYPFGIYHAVNFGETTWYDYAKKIFEITDMSVEVAPTTSEKFVRPAKRPKYSILKNTRGPKLRHWQDALTDYLRNRNDKLRID